LPAARHWSPAAAPGEPVRLPSLRGYAGWLGIVAAEEDGLEGLPPRTRSLRNLTVEAADATPAAKPSLSLLIQFDFNSAKVKPESQQALSNLAQALQSKELVDAKFAVEGHTDAKGRADYNLKLSQQRADAVRAFLASNGVVDARLQAVGKGSSELANSADPLAAENRRVRIVNLN
jgi:outer membrane protein OmpA-like peptidoglycan-associated protein